MQVLFIVSAVIQRVTSAFEHGLKTAGDKHAFIAAVIYYSGDIRKSQV